MSVVKNFSSILGGDGSIPPAPTAANFTNITFTSITMEWEPVVNTSGNPVYIVEMAYSEGIGNFRSIYLSEVT